MLVRHSGFSWSWSSDVFLTLYLLELSFPLSSQFFLSTYEFFFLFLFLLPVKVWGGGGYTFIPWQLDDCACLNITYRWFLCQKIIYHMALCFENYFEIIVKTYSTYTILNILSMQQWHDNHIVSQQPCIYRVRIFPVKT